MDIRLAWIMILALYPRACEQSDFCFDSTLFSSFFMNSIINVERLCVSFQM